jgi:hypothetical protein
MSKLLSVKYNPEARFPQIVGSTDDPELACMYISSGGFPDNFGKLSTQTSTFKEAMLAHMATTDTIEGMLETLTRRLQCIESINTPEEIALCEYTASAAYFSGNIDVVKETMLRVNPAETSPYIRSMHKALTENNWSSERYKATIYSVHSGSIDVWKSEKLLGNHI